MKKKKTRKSGAGKSKRDVTSPDDDTAELDGEEVDGELEPEVAPKGRPSAVDYEQFTRTWTRANSVAEVAAEFGIATTSATAVAGRLRRAGVELKKFPRRGAQSVDVKKLNRIASGKSD